MDSGRPTIRPDRSPTVSNRPQRPGQSPGEWKGGGDRNRPSYAQRPGYPGKYAPPPPATISHVRDHFHGYHNYWTPDWYHHHPYAWYPSWIPANRWWYHPSWHDTWGWFGIGFFTGTMVNDMLNPYPYYYGNNIVYRNNMVYVNGVPYVSAVEYYRQAAELARTADAIVEAAPIPFADGQVKQDAPMLAPDEDTVDKPIQRTVAKPTVDPSAGDDWLPMGTFTVLDENEKVDAVLQLATNKKGQIRGNYVNDETGNTRQIVGAVDSKSQRVALKFTDDAKTVFECGLWNLTQDSVPLLVHLDEDETQQLTLIRLAQPETEDSKSNESEAKKPNGPILIGPGDEDEENLAP